jgi:hypothetical protein
MGIVNRVLIFLKNEKLQLEIRKVIEVYNADKYFNYIDPCLFNIITQSCINLMYDNRGVSEYYGLLNVYQRDPFINQLKYTFKQTFHYKELELSQIKMIDSNVRVGFVINQERSRLFHVHNGMYRTIQLNRKYCFVCVYGQEKKDFTFDVELSPYTKQGLWFQKFEFALIDVVKSYLADIEKMLREAHNDRY